MTARLLPAALLGLLALAAPRVAHAQVPLAGTLTATQACTATLSIRGGDAGVELQPGNRYRLLGKNKPDATFYQIMIGNDRRWVDTNCGQIDAAATQPAANPNSSAGSQPSTGPGARATYVIAVSWEPAFCLAHGGRPECNPAAPGAAGRQLSLHGLWKQPRGTAYCRVDPSLAREDRTHHWDRLPEPDIGQTTLRRLAAIMPGVQSGLERHEWIEHGTCSGLTADAYFARAADLAEQINATPLPTLFARNAGQSLSAQAIRTAADQAFGPGAGARITISCDAIQGTRAITELVIALAGDVTGTTPLPDLIRAAAPAPPSCPGGLVELPVR